MPDFAHQRGELPLAHAGEEAPVGPRPPGGDGGEAREAEGGDGRHDADEVDRGGRDVAHDEGQDRQARVRGEQIEGSRDERAVPHLRIALPRAGRRAQSTAAASVHVGVRTARGVPARWELPVSARGVRSVRDGGVQDPERKNRQGGGEVRDELGRSGEGVHVDAAFLRWTIDEKVIEAN